MPAHITVLIVGDAGSLNKALDESDLRMDAFGSHTQQVGEKAGADLENAFGKSTHRVAGMLDSLGNSMTNMGIPFGNVFNRMASQLDSATTKTKSLGIALKDIGGLTVALGAAAAVGIGGESLHLYSQYEQQLNALEVAVKNAGHSWSSFQGPLAKANESMQKLGYNQSEVAQSLAAFVTATGSPTKALRDMEVAANLAAEKNMSLADATSELMPVLAGSSRAMSDLGLNILDTSGRMETIQQAQQGVHKAQLALNDVQNKMNAGLLAGAAYQDSYRTATLNLQIAQEHLKLSQDSVNKNLDTIAGKVAGAADALGKRLPGQIDVARATLHNLGISIGKDVDEKLKVLEVDLARFVNLLERNKGAVEAVASVIGGVFAVAVGTFLIGLVGKAGAAIEGLGAKVLRLDVLSDKTGKEMTRLAVATEEVTTAAKATVQWVDELYVSMDEASIGAVKLSDSMFAIGPAAATGAGEADAAMLGMIPVADEASAGIKLAIGSTGIGLIFIGLGVALTELLLHWKTVWSEMKSFLDPIVNGMIHTVNGLIHVLNILPGVNIKPFGTIGQSPSGNQPPEWYMKELHLGTAGQVQSQVAALQNDAGLTQMQAIQSLMLSVQSRWDQREAALNKLGSGGGTPANAAQARAAAEQRETMYGSTYGQQEVAADNKKKKAAGGVGGPAATNPDVTAALNQISSMQQAISEGTIASLTLATSAVMKDKMDNLIHVLDTTHKASLEKLAGQIENTWRAELSELNQLEATQQRLALADQTQIMATQMSDMTTYIAGVSAALVQAITDATQTASDRANAEAQSITDTGKVIADTLEERGLYGLNLVAQKMQVSLDQMTQGFDTKAGQAQVAVDRAQAAGDKAVAQMQNLVNQVAMKTDLSVGVAQKAVDQAAQGGTLQQFETSTGLKGQQAQQAYQEALAGRQLQAAQDASAQQVAALNRILGAIQNQAKVAEARMQELIAIEQAKASTEFAGSGVHIEITGINPTDAAAVASAVSWRMRTKVS